MTPCWQSALTADKLMNACECYEIQHFPAAFLRPECFHEFPEVHLSFPRFELIERSSTALIMNISCRFSFFWRSTPQSRYQHKICWKKVFSPFMSRHQSQIDNKLPRFPRLGTKVASIIGIVCKQVCFRSSRVIFALWICRTPALSRRYLNNTWLLWQEDWKSW